LATVLALWPSAAAVAQQTLYWDGNNATAGAAITPTCQCATSSFWSLNSASTVATGSYVASSDVVFSAGTDATGNSTVTITSSTQSANSVTFKDGGVTLAQSTGRLNLGADSLTVATTSGTLTTISSPVTLTASQSWTLSGSNRLLVAGSIALDNPLTLTGGTNFWFTGAHTGTGKVTIAGGAMLNSCGTLLPMRTTG